MAKNLLTLVAAVGVVFLLTWAAVEIMADMAESAVIDWEPPAKPGDPHEYLVWQVLNEAREITRKAAGSDDAK